ncbi:MAG TPA: hypothetical protein VK018_02605 [Porticoccaceae bacterium]|nr:hypothetical protein [Porticoccaceae bacterium]
MIKYLLIALVVLMVVSPLLWLRQTPGQARITAFRNRALQLGLKVQMVPRADADPADRQPDAVRYLKPLVPDSRGAMPVMDHSWILLRDPRRGRESPFPGWRWFRDEAPAAIHPAIAACLRELPESVGALRADGQGLSAYWRETGTLDDVARLARALDGLFPQLGPRGMLAAQDAPH